MAHETAGENAAAVGLLNLAPTDRVLEVGFGHGKTLTEITARVQYGFVAGADASPDMFRLASRSNRDAIARGMLVLKQVASHALPFQSQSFDKLLAVHTLYFWKHPHVELRECRRVLRDGGRMVLGFRAKTPAAEAEFPSSVYSFRTVDEVARLLSESGFSEIIPTEFRSGNRAIALLTARAA
jgi:ubiquinone/menaquinone biosynthesis C-methylase UbiE